MTGVQRFIAQNRNLVAAATLTASAVKPAAAVKQLAVTRAGNGRVRVVGDYTGPESSTIDVEIVDGGATPRASAPVYAGVGNGTLEVVAVNPGATAQTLTYTLVDLGTSTTRAGLAVDEVTIRAQATGAGGNSLRLSVTPDLTLTATAWSLLTAWPASQAYQTGPQWGFGALPLLPSGDLDAASPRIRFGSDPEVYRPFRQYQDGAWRVGLSPALRRDVPAGTRVWAVTGGYDVVVTDGVTPETYPDVVSFYDLLTALAGSALVEVDGIVAADRAPGGMAVVDVPLRTAAWVLSASGVELSAVSVVASADTETVALECVDARRVGGEVWTVRGSKSGYIGQAITGQAFSGGPVALTVPAPPARASVEGQTSWSFAPASRTAGEQPPAVCVKPIRLGVNAASRSITFRYSERPSTQCSCDTLDAGPIRAQFLGLSSGVNMDAEYIDRVKILYAWRETVIRANTARVESAAVGWFFNAIVYSGGAQARIRFSGYADEAAAVIARDDVHQGSVLTGTAMPGYPVEVGGGSADHSGVYVEAVTAIPPGTDLSNWDVSAYTAPLFSTADTVVAYSAASKDLDWLEAVIGILAECLASIYTDVDAVADWDDLLVEAQADLAALSDATSNQVGDVVALGESITTDARYLDRYRATCDNILLTAGILPKSSASADAGGCWRDDAAATHYWVDTSGNYLPAYTNEVYYSAMRDSDGRVVCTQEFAFGLNVGCEQSLKVGDTITVGIGASAEKPLYSLGSVAALDIVAAQPVYLHGGVTGDDTLTWSVAASVDGPLADYDLTALEPSYDHGGAEVQIHRGGLPFGLGDRFDLEVGSAQYRWRQDGGAWFTAADIAAGDLALVDGLSVQFHPGAAPSWLAGDAWQFLARQPHAPSHLLAPTVAAWSWSGTGATLVVALDGEQTVEALALARYDLPAGATVVIEGGDGTDWPESQAMTLTGTVAVALLATPWTVTHLRVTVATATGGRIGWLWAGEPLATTYSAAKCRIARAYAMQRGAGINPARAYLGQGARGELAWDETSPLTQTDLDAILDMLDAMQRAGEPMIVMPHYLHPGEAALVTVDMDAVEPVDYFQLQPDNSAHRIISLGLSLAAVVG